MSSSMCICLSHFVTVGLGVLFLEHIIEQQLNSKIPIVEPIVGMLLYNNDVTAFVRRICYMKACKGEWK